MLVDRKRFAVWSVFYFLESVKMSTRFYSFAIETVVTHIDNLAGCELLCYLDGQIRQGVLENVNPHNGMLVVKCEPYEHNDGRRIRTKDRFSVNPSRTEKETVQLKVSKEIAVKLKALES